MGGIPVHVRERLELDIRKDPSNPNHSKILYIKDAKIQASGEQLFTTWSELRRGERLLHFLSNLLGIIRQGQGVP